MNRNHLALFHAVAHHGGITRAAAQLRISQPAVSKQIAELEGSLGIQLLDRLPRGCRLTQAGTILAEYARRWCGLETEAERAIEEFRGMKRGRLAIGASTTIGAYLVPNILAKFHQRFPEVELQMHIANTDGIQRALMDGSIELGLTEGVIAADELETDVFFQDELVAIAHVRHPLLKKARAGIKDLAREPFIMREEGSGTRAVVERALRKKGLKIKPLLSLASPEAVKTAVACGLGIAIVSRLIIEAELKSGALAVLRLRDFTIRRPLHLQRLRDRTQSPALAAFLKVLHECQRGRFAARSSEPVLRKSSRRRALKLHIS